MTRPSFRASTARPGIQEPSISVSALSAARYGGLAMTGWFDFSDSFSNLLLFLECADEVRHAQRPDNLQVIVKHFE